jgi:hypothetical protein
LAGKARDDFKVRIRQLTRRSGERSIGEVVEKLRPHLLGWKAYFMPAQTPKVWREPDEWMRHRLRAIQLKKWKRAIASRRRPLKMWLQLAHRIGRSSQATPAAVHKFPWSSNTKIRTAPVRPQSLPGSLVQHWL